MSETPTPYIVGKAWSTKSGVAPVVDRDWPFTEDSKLLTCEYCKEPFVGPPNRKCCRACYEKMQEALAAQSPPESSTAEGIIRQIRNLLNELEKQI